MIALTLVDNAKTLSQFAALSPLNAITPTEGTLPATIPTTATRSVLAIHANLTTATLCTDPSFVIPSVDLFQFATLFADQSQFAIPSADHSTSLAHL